MGRSQLKYRATRGRGQGDGTRGGRGGSGRHSGGRRSNGGRALESNAFRYEDREDREDDDDDGGGAVALAPDSARRQFFAEEKQYRDMGDVKEAYFRTKAMQQWDVDEDEVESAGASSGAVGLMDFSWVAEQLAAVPPSLRYQIDAKYCVDSSIDSPVREESLAEVAAPQDVAPTAVAPASTSTSSEVSALDELLALSSSAAGQPAPSLPAKASGTASVQLARPVHSSADPENLEDWLDDVLDM